MSQSVRAAHAALSASLSAPVPMTSPLLNEKYVQVVLDVASTYPSFAGSADGLPCLVHEMAMSDTAIAVMIVEMCFILVEFII